MANRLWLILVAILLIRVSQQQQPSNDPTVTTTAAPTELKVCMSPECVKASNFLLDAMNTTADPCDDFYEYACGQWSSIHPIPDDAGDFTTFSYVADVVRQQLRALYESNATHPAGSVRMIKTAYKICMNVTELDRARSDPLLQSLTSLGGWPLMLGDGWKAEGFDLTTLLATAKQYHSADSVLFEVSIFPDYKNTTRNIINVDQGSLTLGRGSRDYYLNRTAFGSQMAALKQYFNNTAMLLIDDARLTVSPSLNSSIEQTIAFEKKIAELVTPGDARRNSTRMYNKMKIADLYSLLPQVDWVRYFKLIAPQSVHDILSNNTEVSVAEVEYMRKLSTLFSSTDSRTIVNYISWRVVNSMTRYLDDRYGDVIQDFNRVMYGKQTKSPRWKDCSNTLTTFFPLAVGELYVGAHFNKNDKLEAQAMIANIRKSFSQMVLANNWMDDQTKKLAIDKANAMVQNIGFPDFITDPLKLDEKYKTIDISLNDTYFGMMTKAIVYANNNQFSRLKLPVNREEFFFSPAVVNAWYYYSLNSITFFAGILQPPFFSGSGPKSVNYGAVGSIIGHEITHGFDDSGSQYDKKGNLANWWSDASAKGFETRKQCIVDQYNNYTVPEINMKVNGKLTQGENIADNGGIKEAYRAYRTYIAGLNGEEEPRLPGIQQLTNNQLFFLSYASFWCGQRTPANAIQQVLQDEHSPEMFRVNGAVSNTPAFAQAFNCPIGSKMNPKDKCTVW